MSNPFDDPIAYIDRETLVAEYRRLQDQYSRTVLAMQECEKRVEEYKAANARFAAVQSEWIDKVEEWRRYSDGLKARLAGLEVEKAERLEREREKEREAIAPARPPVRMSDVAEVDYDD